MQDRKGSRKFHQARYGGLSRLIRLSDTTTDSHNGTGFYREATMRALLATEFADLLARADVSQAEFARLTGVTPRQINNWARGRAAAPSWAALVAVVLGDHSPEALTIRLEEVLQNLADAKLEPPARRQSG
jgi:DNA-binding transcriptional regulator YiaG